MSSCLRTCMLNTLKLELLQYTLEEYVWALLSSPNYRRKAPARIFLHPSFSKESNNQPSAQLLLNYWTLSDEESTFPGS